MSFWPFCCKPPQVNSLIGGDGQFGTKYVADRKNGRPDGWEALNVAGARSGRVVSSPIKFKSLCSYAGVSEDGRLFSWSSNLNEVRACLHSAPSPVVSRDDSALDRPFSLGASSQVHHEVFQVGTDSDWDFVSDAEHSFQGFFAVKADGSLWKAGGRQHGVASDGQPLIQPQAFRAKLNSPLAGVQDEFPSPQLSSDRFGFGLPVWFTAEPASPVLQKLRTSPKTTDTGRWDVVSVAAGEPGEGAQATAEFRAKIDTGAIRSVSIASNGSGYTPNQSLAVIVTGSDDSGEGADIEALVGSDGRIAEVKIFNPGEGYKEPVTVTISGTNKSATFTVATPRSLRVTSGGSGYTSAPVVTASPAEGETAEGSGTTIRVSEMTRCGVASFEVQSAGQGYTFANATETKTGATATAVVNEAGEIVSWTMTSPGASVHSPLDEEPLSVVVTGDGSGGSASAVPAGSSVVEIEVESNPEVWTKPPIIGFEGGGGTGAEAVAEGIIGRLSLSLSSPGSGYTKTGKGELKRTQFVPCFTVPQANAVGGRVVGGSVIVGEAILAGSGIDRIDEDAFEFCNENNSPYLPPEERLERHREELAKLAVETDGVVEPFEFAFDSVSTPGSLLPGLPPESRAAYVAHTWSAYLRGPGHSRYPLSVRYDADTGEVLASLESPLPISSPPALCIEENARPHNFEYYAEETGDANGSTACYSIDGIYTRPKESPQPWWASPADAMSHSGLVTATGPSGATATYYVIDGKLFYHKNASALAAWTPGQQNPRPASITGLTPYTGPFREITLQDPADAWSQPSLAQRMHFLFPNGGKGLATAVRDDLLDQPVLDDAEVLEAGGEYTEEPEPMLVCDYDPFLFDTELSGCTSIGTRGESGSPVFAMLNGQMHWWGDGSSIGGQYVAKPTPVGGHLRFTATGETLGTVSPISAYAINVGMRLPRPAYGNRVPSFGEVFDYHRGGGIFSNPSAWDSRIALAPGVQTDATPLRYLLSPVRTADHGAGYGGAVADIQYIGPGLTPHTLSVTAEVVPNGLAKAGSSGLLLGADGYWRVPQFTSHDSSTVENVEFLASKTVEVTSSGSGQCGDPHSGTTTVTEGTPIEARWYSIVVRAAGSGYRNNPPGFYEDWVADGGGVATITVSYTRADLVEDDEYTYSPVWLATTTAATLVETVRTSSYGGLPPIRLSVRSTTVPQVTLAGGGTGAVVEVVDLTSTPRASPFPVWCYDALDQSVEPCPSPGLASASGLLRVVSGGRTYTPEAWEASQGVTEIRGIRAWFYNWTYLRYPYVAQLPADFTIVDGHETQHLATHLFRDPAGSLWAVRLNWRGQSFARYVDNNFWLPAQAGEAQHLLAVAPLAIAATDTGEGYDYPAAVSVTQPAGVATGQATIDGKVVGVAVIDGGSGYESPPVVTFANGVASGTATISGPVKQVTVTSGGSGYRLPPRVRFSSPGLSAEAAATVENGQVTSVRVLDGGKYRQAPQVFFDPVKDVESIAVTAGGGGYFEPPAVHIAGGGGTGATATAKISCSVTEIVLTSPGQGYTTTPAVQIVGDGTGAAARAILNPANGQIALVEILSGGTGYTMPPVVTIAGNATAVAKIAGFVSEITVTSRGKDFEEPPTVVITGGGGLGATATATIASPGGGASATATIDGSVVAVTVTSPGSNLQRPPAVHCNHSSPAGGRRNAVLRATVLGRPTSVSVTSGGAGYAEPRYGEDDPPGAKLRTPSKVIRRPTVFAKGSFFFDKYAETVGDPLIDGGRPFAQAVPLYKPPRHAWMNTYPALGLAQLSGGNADAGGSVASVVMPTVVTSLEVTSTGGGYTPGSVLPVLYQGGGVRDMRFRMVIRNNYSLPSVGTPVANAYVGHDGKVAGIFPLDSPVEYGSLAPSLPLGLVAWHSAPTFTISGTGGAQVTARLGHPLECYHSPQALFDGAVEVEADMSLAMAGAAIEQGGPLPSACHGDGSASPFWTGRVDRWNILRTRLSQSRGSGWNPGATTASFPDLRMTVTGSVATFVRVTGTGSPSILPVGFYSPASPPTVVVEDEQGTGATISPLSLPATGVVSEQRLFTAASVDSSGSGYTLSARLRLQGGRPLVWDNPATAFATVGSNGQVASVALSGAGKGYKAPPRVFIVGDGTGAAAVVDDSGVDPDTGAITSLRLTSGGSGYTTATVVIVDRETLAERDPAVAAFLRDIDERYSVLLEECVVERAYIPPELRKFRTTVAVRNAMASQELSAPGLDPAGYASNFVRDLQVSGTRLHPVYDSTGSVEYLRLEGHSGLEMPSSLSVTISPTSDVEPARPATGAASKVQIGSVFSPTVANVTTEFPPYQLTEPDYTDASQTFDVQDSQTYSQDIVGSGTVVKQGPGTLTLTGNNTFTGTLDVKAGVVIATSPPSVAEVSIAAGAAVVIANGGIHSGRVTGSGTLVKEGDGDLRLSDTSGFSGDILLEEGSLSGAVNLSSTLVVSGGATLSADVTLNGGTLIFDLDEPGEFSGSITGSGTVIKRGVGRLEFNGEADFAGDFVFEAGPQSLGGNGTFSDRATLQGEASLDDGSLSGVAKVSGLLRVSDGASLLADVILDGLDGRLVFDIDTGGEGQYSGTITGDGTVIKQGQGRLEFNGEAAFNGQFDFQEGTLDGKIIAGADASLVVGGQMLADVELGSNGVYWTLYSDAAYDGVISGEGFVLKGGPGLLILSAKSTYTGDFIVKGPIAIPDGGGLTADIQLDGQANVFFDLSSSYEYEGVIKGGGTVTKRGDGVLTLTQASIFVGILDVEEGSLIVRAGVSAPAPFESATYTPDSLVFEFSGEPAGNYVIFNAETAQSYPVVTLEGTTATGVYNSSISRLTIN